MKTSLLLIALSSLTLMAQEPSTSQLNGFLGVQSCVQNGLFSDCNLKEYHDGEKVVAVINGQVYPVKKGVLAQSTIDQYIMKGNLNFDGTIESGVLHLNNISIPTLAATGPKEKFKGCM